MRYLFFDESLQAPDKRQFAAWEGQRRASLASGKLKVRVESLNAMTKTLDTLAEVIRDPKPTFRQIDDRPQKAKKHRYERRKIRECLRLGDWVQEEPA